MFWFEFYDCLNAFIPLLRRKEVFPAFFFLSTLGRHQDSFADIPGDHFNQLGVVNVPLWRPIKLAVSQDAQRRLGICPRLIGENKRRWPASRNHFNDQQAVRPSGDTTSTWLESSIISGKPNSLHNLVCAKCAITSIQLQPLAFISTLNIVYWTGRQDFISRAAKAAAEQRLASVLSDRSYPLSAGTPSVDKVRCETHANVRPAAEREIEAQRARNFFICLLT